MRALSVPVIEFERLETVRLVENSTDRIALLDGSPAKPPHAVKARRGCSVVLQNKSPAENRGAFV